MRPGIIILKSTSHCWDKLRKWFFKICDEEQDEVIGLDVLAAFNIDLMLHKHIYRINSPRKRPLNPTLYKPFEPVDFDSLLAERSLSREDLVSFKELPPPPLGQRGYENFLV